jgi:hypothetical protein
VALTLRSRDALPVVEAWCTGLYLDDRSPIPVLNRERKTRGRSSAPLGYYMPLDRYIKLTPELGDVDANIIAAAVTQLLQRRDGEAALTLRRSHGSPMPRIEAKGSIRMVSTQRVPLSKIEMGRIFIRDGCRYCG